MGLLLAARAPVFGAVAIGFRTKVGLLKDGFIDSDG
jgi:hypothetical protein